MKAKIKVGGVDAEIEGTPSEIAQVLTALRTAPVDSPAFVPSFQLLDPCPMGGSHEYPESWMSTYPPACKKCNQHGWYLQAQMSYSDIQLNPGLMPPCRTTIVTRQEPTHSAELVALLEGLPAPQGCTD